MDELLKVVRVIKKVDPDAPHETLLVLDATVASQRLAQENIFGNQIGVSGIVMTKLDGTARGGVPCACGAGLRQSHKTYRRGRRHRRSSGLRRPRLRPLPSRSGGQMTVSPNARKWIRAVVDYGGLVAWMAAYFLGGRNLVNATWALVGGSLLGLALGLIFERRIAPVPLIAGAAGIGVRRADLGLPRRPFPEDQTDRL